MCGILGKTKNNRSIVPNNASQSIAHRGPDYTGTYEDASIYLCHTLLAIRGVTSESEQPVTRQDSPWVLAFNGQIYNTQHIRTILGTSAPHTEVDTHLIYALIEKFGWDFVSHIHGMFAIALYHKDEQVVRLYRDQSGQKNLYYTLSEGEYVFSSEIKGLYALGNPSRNVDQLGMALACSIGYIPGDRTLMQGVKKVRPSEVVTYTLRTQEISQATFLSRGESHFSTDTLHTAISETISEHLQSKQSIAINLSGGLDSSIIFHEASTQGMEISAFSTLFDTDNTSANIDALLAEKLAREYGQKFTPIHITKSDYLDCFIPAYESIEEPNYNISNPIYYKTAVSEGIHNAGLRVVLSGDGGDELFGGYPHYAKMQRIETFKRFMSTRGVNWYKHLRNGGGIDYGKISDIFYDFKSLTKNEYGVDAKMSVRTYLETLYRDVIQPYAIKHDDVYTMMLMDRYTWLASENFIRSDKIYMSQSMEMRCPFSYTPLRTWVDEHLTSHEYISTDLNKIALRKLYADRLPDYIVHRKDKSGWRAPVQSWYGQEIKNLFLQILTSMDTNRCGIDWQKLVQEVEHTDSWPGKHIHLYISLAIIIRKFNLH
jgi:asparagine synthase (glutamine-hydrolysing)